MNIRSKILICVLMAVLLASTLCVCASAGNGFAARLGSLNVIVSDDGVALGPGFKVALCKVAEPDGTLLPAFAASGISSASLLDETSNADNAKALLPYASAAGGEEDITDASGTAHFSGLDKGVYIVYSPAGQGCIFDPFLLYMPTVIAGSEHYDVVSSPKAEDDPPTPTPPPGGVTPTPVPGDPPAEPTPPVEPTPPGGEGGEGGEDPGKPVLPLTGVERRPIWILLGLGSALIIFGVIQLCRGREQA